MREQCYRLISIDAAGNQRDTTEVVCAFPCLNFVLPNVITRAIQVGVNDFLTAFNEHREGVDYCLRAAQRIRLNIFNR